MSIAARRLRRAAPPESGGGGGVTPAGHGQEINATNTGRTGAAAAGVANYSSSMTTLTGPRTYSGTQTIRNTNFTGQVEVTSGNVTFEFCRFAFVPTASAENGGGYFQFLISGGITTLNWCDLDTGYRVGGNQGTYACTDSFTASERTKPVTTNSRFTLYRTHIQGCNQAVAVQNYLSSGGGSFITECLMDNLVSPQPTSPYGHPDSIELRSADNITIERCRIDCGPDATAHINRTADWGDDNHLGGLIKDNYFIGISASPILIQPENSSYPRIYNMRVVGNRFTDSMFGSSSNGRIVLASAQNATYSSSYASANQPIIYWGHSGADMNVWAPDGVGVMSGQTPGSAVGVEDFFKTGTPDTWNGSLLP